MELHKEQNRVDEKKTLEVGYSPSDDGFALGVDGDHAVSGAVGQENLLSRKTIRHVAIVGAGFLADAYDLFIINNVLAIMAPLYPQQTIHKSLCASAAVWGAVIGQLVFGGFADYIGRKLIFMTTCVLIIVGALGSSLSFDTPGFGVYGQLALWRFFIGIGVGGEYPLAATIAAESSTSKFRGRMLASVFAMQGFGKLLAAVVAVVLLQAGCPYEVTWRLCLALGALPPIIVFYFRGKMHETEDFVEAKTMRTSHRRNLRQGVTMFWKQVLGTSLAWFFLDITFYGNGLFNTTITGMMGLGDSVEDKALNSLITVCFAVPGYWFTVYFLDKIGRWNIQAGGFIVLIFLYLILGTAYKPLSNYSAIFITLYGATYFFGNFGPNATTFIIPGEYFPTEVKASCHGVSAAAGKVGAGLAAIFYPIIAEEAGLRAVMFVSAATCVAGLASTWLVPKYTSEQLDELKVQHQRYFAVNQDSMVETDHSALEKM